MATYSINVKTLAGGSLLSSMPVEELSFGDNLNAPGSCNVAIPLFHESSGSLTSMAGGRTLEVNRDGILRWAGYIWATDTDLSGQKVSFSAEGWFSRLRKRTINETYSYNGVNQLDIAWDIIANIQSYESLGITRGAEVDNGKNRKVIYCCYEHVTAADAIEELAFADDGFDFEITPQKVWKAYAPRKGGTSGHTFFGGSSPTSSTNIFDIKFTEDAADLVTEISVVPDTDYCNDIEVVTATTAATYGKLEEVINADKRMKDRVDRVAFGREYLRLHRVPRTTVTLSTEDMPWGNYEVGDTVNVDFAAGYVSLNQNFRVLSYRVDVVEGNELCELELDSVIAGTI